MAPKTIVIEDDITKEALIRAVEVNIDYVNDTMYENSPLFASNFKKLVEKCGCDTENLEPHLREARNELGLAIDQVIALKLFLKQLKSL